MLKLTIIQRSMMLVAAGVIASVLWMQVEDRGLDETPWLIGVLVILTLSLFALSPAAGNSSATSATVSKIQEHGPATVESLLGDARREMSAFHRSQIDRTSNGKKRKSLQSQGPFLIVKAAYIAVYLLLSARLKNFRNTVGFKELASSARAELAHLWSMDQILFRNSVENMLPGVSYGKTVEQYAGELAQEMLDAADQVARECEQLVRSGDPRPLDPALKYLQGNVAAQTDKVHRGRQSYEAPFLRFLKANENAELQEPDFQLLCDDPAEPELPPELERVVDALVGQIMQDSASGKQPEARLVPHNKIKRDIIIQAYMDDMKREISRLYDQRLDALEISDRSQKIKNDAAGMIYRLKREPSATIIRLFDEMSAARTDIALLERRVRSASSDYHAVPPLT